MAFSDDAWEEIDLLRDLLNFDQDSLVWSHPIGHLMDCVPHFEQLIHASSNEGIGGYCIFLNLQWHLSDVDLNLKQPVTCRLCRLLTAIMAFAPVGLNPLRCHIQGALNLKADALSWTKGFSSWDSVLTKDSAFSGLQGFRILCEIMCWIVSQL